MLLALILSVSLFFLTLCAYVKTTPEHLNARSRTLYNLTILSLALLVCLMLYARAYLDNGLSIERAVLSLLAYLQSLLGATIIFIVGGLFRNFILFRKKR